jgi:cytochrome c-type protein NapB
MRGKYVRIAGTAALMIAGVFIAGSIVRRSGPGTATPGQPLLEPAMIEGEAATFALASKALTYANAPEKAGDRTLDKFYSLRAFPSAPPVIPHELLEDKSMGGKGCLGCHKDGGYVPPFKAYAPVTPHPQLENCRQCHVAQTKAAAFAAESMWQRPEPPEIDLQSLAGGPPPIPHSLQMRENCLACHAGPGAVAKIRTPHPERVNCRQCHVPAETNEVFVRAGGLQ